jgi:hypothetical protein
MQTHMDIIKFTSGLHIYRLEGEHEYAIGKQDVASIKRTMDVAHMPSPQSTLPVVKNLSGKFTTFMLKSRSHDPVKQKTTGWFGCHDIIYHLHGTVDIYCGVAHFKGCAGLSSLKALAEDLFMESAQCEVHQGVFKLCLGRRLDTNGGCMLECNVRDVFRCMRVRARIFEECMAVKLSVDSFDESELPYLKGDLTPLKLDVSVTGSGVVSLRFSWAKCQWTDEVEADVLKFCSWMGETLRKCC